MNKAFLNELSGLLMITFYFASVQPEFKIFDYARNFLPSSRKFEEL
jgi:hypothetical protein